MQHPLETPEIRGALLHAMLLALHLPGQRQAPLRGVQIQRLQELLLLPEARETMGLLRLPASQVSGCVLGGLGCWHHHFLPLGRTSVDRQVCPDY